MNVARLRFVRTPAGLVGCVLLAAVLAAALFGPLFAPYAPDEPVGVPFSGPAEGTPFGTDFLGRDVLSRVLWGGRSVLAWPGSPRCWHTPAGSRSASSPATAGR